MSQEAAPTGAAFVSRLAARVGRLFWLKTLSTPGGIALFFVAYFWAMRHPLSEVSVMPMIWIDHWIGFQPLSFPLYASLWLYIGLAAALARDFRDLAAFGAASLAISAVGLAIFMLLPTKVPDFGIDWSLYPSLEFMKSVDVSGNACPSLHAAFCVFAAVVLHAQLSNLDAPRWLIVANVLWSLGILGSTVATRQHVALDAIAGAALGGAVALAYARALARS
ncbi:MAG: phosphatase PAP2 family protein [Burkholderiales bacterium]